jgi:hypothetical protein
MAKIIPTRGSQNVQVSEFVVSFNDTMADATGNVVKDMGAITAGDFFKALNMAPGVEIVGGEIQVEVQGVGPSPYTVEVGTSSDGTVANFNSHLSGGAISLLTAVGTRTPLVLTNLLAFPGLISAAPNDIFIRLIRTGAIATAGRFVIRVMHITRGKVNEAIPA